jgi:hypothetical protein
MSPSPVQQDLANTLSSLHPRQRDPVALLVLAVLVTPTLSLAQLGREASIGTDKSPRALTKQFDRLLSSFAIDPFELWRAWALHLLRDASSVHVAIDWTSVQGDQFRILMAAVCVEGRAIPIAALVIPTSKRKALQVRTEAAMLAKLRFVVPHGISLTILADRGFDGIAFRRAVVSHGFGYIIRARVNLRARYDGHRWQRLRSLCPPKGEPAKRFSEVLLTEKRDKVPAVVAKYAEGAKEPWLLLTSLEADAEAVCTGYSHRFLIEELFKDLKNVRFGMGLESLSIGDPRRLERLLPIVGMAYTLIRATGEIAKRGGLDKTFSTRGAKQLKISTFSLGRFYVRASPSLLQQAFQHVPALEFLSPP